MMMMKSVIWWRKPKYPEETTDLWQVTDETFSHIRLPEYLCVWVGHCKSFTACRNLLDLLLVTSLECKLSDGLYIGLELIIFIVRQTPFSSFIFLHSLLQRNRQIKIIHDIFVLQSFFLLSDLLNETFLHSTNFGGYFMANMVAGPNFLI